MKVCSKCNEEKTLSEFNKHKNGLTSWCKTCVRKASRKEYNENKEKYLAKYKIIADIKRDFFNSLKEGKKCEKCDETHIATLDFHHIDPNQKEFEVGSFFNRKSIKHKQKILDEVKKCVILCSNCHRIFHYIERQNGITIQEYLNGGFA